MAGPHNPGVDHYYTTQAQKSCFSQLREQLVDCALCVAKANLYISSNVILQTRVRHTPGLWMFSSQRVLCIRFAGPKNWPITKMCTSIRSIGVDSLHNDDTNTNLLVCTDKTTKQFFPQRFINYTLVNESFKLKKLDMRSSWRLTITMRQFDFVSLRRVKLQGLDVTRIPH